MNSYNENLKWRYATKKFDKSRRLNNEQLNDLKKSLQLSASSYGLQPYKFLIIENDELRKELRKHSYDQPQITDASHLIVFCTMTDYSEKDVDEFIELTAKTQAVEIDSLSGLSKAIKGKVNSFNDESRDVWAAKQVYIALGNLLSAAANAGIDACPMEGFEAEKYNEVLDLKAKGLSAKVLATIGFRDSDDKYARKPKVRKDFDSLFINL